MLAKESDFQQILGLKSVADGNSDCSRPIGGKCVGNCRKIDETKYIAEGISDCSRPKGGHCVGNCRKIEN